MENMQKVTYQLFISEMSWATDEELFDTLAKIKKGKIKVLAGLIQAAVLHTLARRISNEDFDKKLRGYV